MNFNEIIEKHIKHAVKSYDGSYNNAEPLKDLVSMGELVDRLSIINFKLYTLKDKVMESEDKSFRAWASIEDVKLVMERSRLKRAIDSQLVHTINNILSGDSSGGVNYEVKRYGNEERS
tara:strand:+ start:204 stop:560 length:357 start_codon:yes stop_codon:yes gene_type:complete